MNQSAAVMVLDHVPSDQEIEEIAYSHLEEFDADEATATFELVHKAPDWMNICEQDQINAYVRDQPRSIILVVYMVEGELEDEAEDETGF